MAAAILLFTAAVLAGEGVKEEVKLFQGKWVITSLVRDGKADEAMAGAERVHASETYTVTPKAGPAVAGTYTLDPSKTPKAIDMMPTGGRYKGQTLKGVYKVEGDKLTVCFAEPGKERPADFASKPGSGHVLAVHERVKP